VEVTEWQPSVPQLDIPAYLPAVSGDPRPAPWPPDWTAWRFGDLWCARDAAGTIVATWHHCPWRVLTPGVSPAAVIAQLAGAPVVLTPPTAFWTRLIRPAGPATAWLCGGTLPPADLAALAASLPEP
jgi:hypothetical protein